MAKISTGAVGVCLYLPEIWRCRASIKRKDLVFSGAVGAIVGWLVLEMASGNRNVHQGGFSFVLWHHLSYYMYLPVKWISIPYFIAGHFSFSWIALCLCVWALWSGSGLEREKLTRFLFANFVGIGIGVLAVSFFKVAAAAFFYFSNVSMFLALPVILAIWSSPPFALSLKKLRRWSVPMAASVVLAVVCVAGVLSHGIPKIKGAIHRLREDAGKAMVKNERGYYLARLKEIRTLAHRERFLVYIPKKEQSFWRPEDMYPQFAGFSVPAIAEVPAIFGLPNSSDLDSMGLWGLGDYPRQVALEGDAAYLPAAVLRAETAKLGYNGYIVVERDQATWCRVRGD
jgi:hypothetical protein